MTRIRLCFAFVLGLLTFGLANHPVLAGIILNNQDSVSSARVVQFDLDGNQTSTLATSGRYHDVDIDESTGLLYGLRMDAPGLTNAAVVDVINAGGHVVSMTTLGNETLHVSAGLADIEVYNGLIALNNQDSVSSARVVQFDLDGNQTSTLATSGRYHDVDIDEGTGLLYGLRMDLPGLTNAAVVDVINPGGHVVSTTALGSESLHVSAGLADIEVFSTAIPEPSAFVTLSLVLAGAILFRRTGRKLQA